MAWYWWAAILIWGVGPCIFLPLWYLAVKYRRRGPGWTEPMTLEAEETYRRWPLPPKKGPDFRILYVLHKKGPRTTRQLAILCSLGPVALYPALQRLERAKFITAAWVDRGKKRVRMYALAVQVNDAQKPT